MTERETESRRSGRGRGPGPARWLYGALLVAIGACIGIVIGSVSDTPRMLVERMRGPVETVDLDTPAPPPVVPAEATPPLEAYQELQGAPAKAAPAPAAKRETAAVTPPAPAAPKPAAPAVASPPPVAAAPAPAKSADQLVRELEKKTAASPAPPTLDPNKKPVIQVLSLAERKQADSLVVKLKSQGFDPYVTAMPDKSGRFRVRVRTPNGQNPAELEQRLKALGLKTWITAE
jgi:cell division septation protein DedD